MAMSPREAESSARRALRVLDALAVAPRPLTNVELAERLAIGASSSLTLMRDLCRGGFAVWDPRTKRYGLGPQAAGLGSRLHRAAAISPSIGRLVQRLAAATGESVSLATLFETRILVLKLTRGPDGDQPALHEGMIGPLLGSGAGVCILSLISERSRAQLIRRCRHYGDPFGPGRRDLADLQAAIHCVRTRGFIAQYIEAAGGVAGIAFPLRLGMTVHRYGAVIIGGRAARMRRREREIVAAVLRILPSVTRRSRSLGNSSG